MSEEKPKHEIKIQVTQDNTFQLQFAITEDRENPPELIALELLKTTVASLAERLNVKSEFLAETMYHDFTKGDFIEVDN
ncbi:hypothetical protein [Streptococcus pluranimalium]|uniref:hypothetical protein n=1 Tax=Streptococcus pluranimalium TaxID=82348 RepID=UPI003F68D455